MIGRALRKAVAVALSFTMVLESGAALAYAAGAENGATDSNRTDIEKIINDRSYDPDRPLAQERAGVFLDDDTSSVINGPADAA